MCTRWLNKQRTFSYPRNKVKLTGPAVKTDTGVEDDHSQKNDWSIAVTTRSKTWVCGRLTAGIAGSNPAGGMDVCLL
jgi:hypothetical protein